MFIAWTTVATREDADRLAVDAVRRGLAACVQIEGPVISHYVWAGQLEQSEEFRLMYKVLPARLAALGEHVARHHPYTTPEWVVIRAETVGEKYLSWATADSSSPPL